MTDKRPQTVPTRVLLGRGFRWFYLGRAVDMTGSSMTPVVLALAVLGESHRLGDLSVVLAAQMAPRLILLLVGGVVADRLPRRTLLVIANLGSFATQGVMAAILLGHHYRLLLLAVLSLASGALDAFASPALRGMVPELVRHARVQQANSLLASTQNVTRILGPSVGGALVATTGGGWALALDAASYLLAAACYTRIRDSGRTPRTHTTFLQDLRHGWGAFMSLRWVAIMTASFALINAANVGPWNILGPDIVTRHNGAASWGVVVSVRAIGLLAMSALLYRISLRHPLRTGGLVGAFAALPLFALGLSGSAWIVGAFAFVGALGFSLTGVVWETALQQRVPSSRLARVASYDDLFSYLSIPLSQLAVGPIAARVGASTTALGAGMLYLAASLLPLLSRDVRDLTNETTRTGATPAKVA